VIDLPEDQPDAVKSMLQFLYTTSYNTEPSTLLMHTRTYCIAGKYGLDALQHMAYSRLQRWRLWFPINETDCALAIKEIYANTEKTDRESRFMIAEVIRKSQYLLDNKDGDFA
jgi:hypothetical protein